MRHWRSRTSSGILYIDSSKTNFYFIQLLVWKFIVALFVIFHEVFLLTNTLPLSLDSVCVEEFAYGYKSYYCVVFVSM